MQIDREEARILPEDGACATENVGARGALPGYQFDGKRLTLRGRGSYICDMSFAKSPNRTYGWDLDLNIPVFEKLS